MKRPTRHSLSALIAATAVLGLPAANAWAEATASPSAATAKAKAAAAKAAAAKTAAAKRAAAAKAAATPVRRTIVGPTSDMRWGPVTVTIVVEGTKVVDASADMPLDKARSEYLNSRVGPYLLQQLLETQSAQVELITGATMTCESYAESLQGALDKAGIKAAAASFSAHAAGNATPA